MCSYIFILGMSTHTMLTIPLGPANNINSSSLVNPLGPLHHLQQQPPPQSTHTGNYVDILFSVSQSDDNRPYWINYREGIFAIQMYKNLVIMNIC